MTVQLVRASKEDLAALMCIEAQVQSPLYSPNATASLRRLVAGEGGAMYLIVTPQGIAGSASVEVEGEWVELGSVIVLDRFRNRGIGKEAVRQRLALYKNQGYRKFRCHVHPDNEASLRIRSNLGFTTAERIENAFGDGEPRLLLTLQY